MDLEFERMDRSGLDPFRVKVAVFEDDLPLGGISSDISFAVSRGNASPMSETTLGNYHFTVTPDQTGEYEIIVSYKDLSMTRTALVLDGVHADWGQPMAVPGLVNTPGYEDGVTITPDGNYLFVQYGPIYFSAIELFNTPRANGGCEGHRLEYPAGTPNRCTHTWLDNTIGPSAGPERPGFFDGRISGTTILHNANSWGVLTEQAPNFAPFTMFYGFKRQPDGSFAEPFYLAFDDENDGIINTSGLSFLLHGDGTATIVYSIDDPSNPDMVDLDNNGTDDIESYHDIFTSEIVLEQDNILGTFIATGIPGTPPVRGTPFPAQLLDFGKTGTDGIAGTQGNPHLYCENGIVKSIWTDDERDSDADRGEISVYVLASGSFPGEAWQKIVLPLPVNKASPSDEIQPFFTGTGLYYTHFSDTEFPEVYYISYAGGHSIADLQNPSNWGVSQKILEAVSADSVGQIIGLGEPTIATVNDREYLYFVYGYIRDYDTISGLPDIDMQAGFIIKR
jgi:hypothetical protein